MSEPPRSLLFYVVRSFRLLVLALTVLVVPLLARAAPVTFPAANSVSATHVAAGHYHTCSVTGAGGVRCWGDNSEGQLGDGTTTDRATPVDVSGLTSNIVDVAGGYEHTCALTSTGRVLCWGNNGFGQLGDGTSTNHTTPVEVSGLSSDVTAITVGHYHTCAITDTGSVYCWGDNGDGQLGDGTTMNFRRTPVQVAGISSSVTHIAAGYDHTCAVTSADDVRCWGSNGYGQLGDGTTTSQTAPVEVAGLPSGTTNIAASYAHTCAVTSTGGLHCWGANWSGQLGDGTTTNRVTPVTVVGLSTGVTDITTGRNHTCAVTDTGSARCWGYNWSGRLGDGTSIDSATPVDVIGLSSEVTVISASEWHTCAVRGAGDVYCWGRNNYGQLGDGTTTNHMTPVAVTGFDAVYVLDGRVTDSGGSGISGVTISAGSETTTTASDGTYTLSGMSAGSYSVSASKTDCTFSPSSRSVSVPPDRSSQNFTATCTIPDTTPPDGYITSPSEGQTIGPSTITFSANAWDNSGGSGVDRVEYRVYYDGFWHNAGSDSSAPYAVSWTTPDGLTSQQLQFAIWVYDRAGNYVVDPGGKVYVNFEAPTISSISGTVRDGSGNGLSGVTISAGSTSTTTASNGTYTLNGLAEGTYTVNASKTGCTFSPSSRSVSVPPDRSSQNFTADCTVPTYTVSGQVTDGSGNGVSNVTITGGGQSITTSSNGSYTISGLTSGSYTIRASKTNCTFSPSSRSVSVPPDRSGRNFTASCTIPTYTVSGRVANSDGNAVSGVTISAGGKTATTSSNGTYTISGLTAGSYNISASKDGYTVAPASRSVSVPPDATGQDFTATLHVARVFEVDRDGLSFPNFGYTGADWEDFQHAFPDTPMELPNGQRRKGPERYFTEVYTSIGEGGNCAGFTAVSLIHFLGLSETVERDLLLPEHRAISPAYQLPGPGSYRVSVHEHDVADYIHLYQARQMSWQYNQWWFAEDHINDTPQEVFAAITQYTANNEPVAVSIRQAGQGGHRMTAYRTEQSGSTGYIYVYDNNWPGDDTRRIEINLTTGRWSYALSSQITWSGTATGTIRYSPGSLNFPASLPPWHDTDTMLQTNGISGTHLTIEGDATLLMTDNQGRRLGFENGNLVSDISGADYLPIEAFDPEHPDAPAQGMFFLPAGSDYTVTIASSESGSYTLSAFANNSAMSLEDIEVAANTSDMLVLDKGVQEATFAPTTDTDYCHYITQEVSDTDSREYVNCVSSTNEGNATFALNPTSETLTVENEGSGDLTVDVTVDQVGSDAHTDTVQDVLPPSDSLTVSRGANGNWQASGNTVYLPVIQR